MTTHILSLTYAPKIPLVKSGECTQTIRLHNPDRPKKVGDKLILHTWEGKPYRSKWDWRLETEISECELLRFPGDWMWQDAFEEKLDRLAMLDGIASGDGIDLVYALLDLNRLGRKWGVDTISLTDWDIIRWPKPTIRRVE